MRIVKNADIYSGERKFGVELSIELIESHLKSESQSAEETILQWRTKIRAS